MQRKEAPCPEMQWRKNSRHQIPGVKYAQNTLAQNMYRSAPLIKQWFRDSEESRSHRTNYVLPGDWEISQQARNHPVPPPRNWVVFASCGYTCLACWLLIPEKKRILPVRDQTIQMCECLLEFGMWMIDVGTFVFPLVAGTCDINNLVY